MPIFEYDCNRCGISFEKLVRNTTASVNVEKIACPKCNSRKIKRRMSTFAHAVAGGSSTPKSSGATCSGNCSGGCKGCGHQH
jgi:putative FmdB family regulatory protein